MMPDPSKPGWLVLHCSCDALHLSHKQTEGRPLWELFAVHNMVRCCKQQLNLFACCTFLLLSYAVQGSVSAWSLV